MPDLAREEDRGTGIAELFMVLLGISGGTANEAVIGIFAIAFCAVVVRLVTGYIEGE